MDRNTQYHVWNHNIRYNQIGGLTDGITPEVAEDIGYKPPQIVNILGSIPSHNEIRIDYPADGSASIIPDPRACAILSSNQRDINRKGIAAARDALNNLKNN